MRLLARSALACLCFGCGPDDLFVTADLGPDKDCEYVPEASLALDQVVFDIAEGGDPGSEACADPYIAHLLTENPNSETVLVDSADVLLMTVQTQAIAFVSDVPLPNPFVITVASHLPAERSGIAAVEVIPVEYAPYLSVFVGARLMARVTLSGTTSDDAKVRSNAFDLPIDVCDGCRTLCRQEDTIDADVPEPECSDVTLGAGRLWCIDPDC